MYNNLLYISTPTSATREGLVAASARGGTPWVRDHDCECNIWIKFRIVFSTSFDYNPGSHKTSPPTNQHVLNFLSRKTSSHLLLPLPQIERIRVEGSPCTPIEEHLCRVIDIIIPHAISPGSLRIPRHLPLMSLESGRIWTTRPLFIAPDFLEKLFLALDHVILCAHLFWFHSSPNRSTAALDAAKLDVCCIPFWAQVIQKKIIKMWGLRDASFYVIQL
jgi:hypothetical protein